MRRDWTEAFRDLGSAVLALLQAELEALERELARSGRSAAVAVGLFGAAVAVGFWTVGLGLYFLVQLLAVWLPLWAASLIVTALFAAVTGGLAWSGLRKLREFENPLATARRRLDDHLDWWQDRVLEPGSVRRVGAEGRGARLPGADPSSRPDEPGGGP